MGCSILKFKKPEKQPNSGGSRHFVWGDGGGVWGGVSLPTGGGAWVGGYARQGYTEPPPQKIFSIFY